MTTYTIQELANMKGTSEPVRQALFAMQEKIHRLEAQGVKHWVGLTAEEVVEAGKLHIEGERMLPYSFARAIEQVLKEKNT
jgi:hypothetical protein